MELLEKGWEIRRNWSVGIDEDLTMEERRVRWKLVERTRKERAKGKTVVTTNRRIWVDGKAWEWDNERNGWGRWRGRRRKIIRLGKGKREKLGKEKMEAGEIEQMEK